MRNLKYVNTIKDAVEAECPLTVSCADIVALSARDGIVMVRLLPTQIILNNENNISLPFFFKKKKKKLCFGACQMKENIWVLKLCSDALKGEGR